MHVHVKILNYNDHHGSLLKNIFKLEIYLFCCRGNIKCSCYPQQLYRGPFFS
jgi:hypothetical protein